MTGRQTPSRLARSITLQRMGLVVENLWPRLHWPLMVLLLAVAVLASGILSSMGGMLRIAVLGILGLSLLYSLKDLIGFRWPSARDAMRRIELASQVNHRAVSSHTDKLSPEFLDPRMDAVFEEHQRRQLLAAESLKVSPPKSAWRLFDGRALRVPFALAALAALLLGPGDLRSNLVDAARLVPAVPPKPLTIDAWLKPPAYTGKPPLLITAPAMAEKLKRGEEIIVPEGSSFVARISGAKNPKLSALDFNQAPIAEVATLAKVADDTLAVDTKLARPMVLVLSDDSGELLKLPVSLLPDAPPTISINSAPTSEARGNLVITWEAKDDYGVKSIAGELTIADEQADGVGFESNGIFLFDPPELKLSLRRPNTKEDKGKATQDFAAHPWAGLKVLLELTVKDGAGQEGKVTDFPFTMPERQFVRPMARALIEQRKKLIFNPEKYEEVVRILSALMIFPDGLVERSGHVVAISTVVSRLRNAGGHDDVKQAINALWDIAVDLDEGSLADARAELLALKKELEKALQDGAPPERIAELMDRLRQAMDKFMDQMRQEAERRMKDGTLPQQNQQGQAMTRENLQKMLDALEEMSKNGSKDMAQQMLDELERMLQNMEPGMAQQPGEGDGELSQMLDELGQMMQRQQRLMDDTQRLPGQGEQPGEEGEGEGQLGQGEQGEEGNRGRGGSGSSGTLADRQKSLRDMLNRLLEQGENGQGGQGQGRIPQELEDALREMEGAEKGLREGDRDSALQDEGEALDNLRKGANRMAQELRENGQGQAEGATRDGEGRAGKEDPLGRPRATRNPDTGPDDEMVPNELAIRRAREILETLRGRANDGTITDAERGYIERLLRGLY